MGIALFYRNHPNILYFDCVIHKIYRFYKLGAMICIPGGVYMEQVLEKKRDLSKVYQSLLERREELFEKGKELYLKGEDTIQYDMEMDCIDHFFECEGWRTYEAIAKFCKENQIERVVDIGCSYGHQSECFLHEGIDYVGVNDGNLRNFWNQDRFQYILGRYPCEVPVKPNDLGVSVLCLTWNCYLYENEKTLKEQCEALKRDFDHCLLYITNEAKNYVSQYFKKVKSIGKNLYYFSK